MTQTEKQISSFLEARKAEGLYPDCGSGCAIGLEEDDPAEARRSNRRWWGIAISAVLAGYAMTLDIALVDAEASPRVLFWLHGLLIAATAVSAALLGPSLLAAAWGELRHGRVTIELLFIAGLGGAFGASMLSVVTGRGPVYFETVIVLLAVHAAGRQLTDLSRRRALRTIEGWRGAPETCEAVRPDGATDTRPVAAIGVGQAVRVHPGRAIPIDGTVIEGEAFVQESQLTGEFFAARRAPGDAVFAGSYSLDGTLTIRATAPGLSRRIDRLAEAVALAQATPSRLTAEADRLTRWFLPLVLAASASAFAGWTAAAGWRTGLMNAMSVLLVACPCAMGFATPAAVWSVLGRLALAGIVPRRGDLVERLAGVDTVVFDKTGTLTDVQPALVDLAWAGQGELSEGALRRLIGAVQRAGDHPLAAALGGMDDPAEPPASSLPPVSVLGLRVLPGRGVAAECEADGRRASVVIGSEAVIETDAQRAAWEPIKRRLAGQDRGRLVAVLADGAPAAGAVVAERPRADGPAVLSALRRQGLRLVLMTGDRPELAAGLGLDEVYAGLTPEQKRDRVDAEQSAGRRVLYVGDGINDAVAMTRAEVALAIGAGAPLAVAAADATLIEPDLGRLPWAIALCRRGRRTIRVNLWIAAAYNTAGIAVACAGLLHPVAAAVLMTCSSLTVIWRALRLLEPEPGEFKMNETNAANEAAVDSELSGGKALDVAI